MPRLKNVEWNLSRSADGTVQWEAIQVAVLMDIRDELQRLNRILGCYRLPDGMDALRRIYKRLKKKLPLK